jgi:hypothetical protein
LNKDRDELKSWPDKLRRADQLLDRSGHLLRSFSPPEKLEQFAIYHARGEREVIHCGRPARRLTWGKLNLKSKALRLFNTAGDAGGEIPERQSDDRSGMKSKMCPSES